MIRAYRFLKATSPYERSIAYGNAAWALALAAAFVGLFAAVTGS